MFLDTILDELNVDFGSKEFQDDYNKVVQKYGKRDIWIPNMKVSKLEKLLKKENLTEDDIEDLKDFRFFLLTDKESALDKGFYTAVGDTSASGFILKNKYWLVNINSRLGDK